MDERTEPGNINNFQIFVFVVINVVSHLPSTSFFVSCFVFTFFLSFTFFVSVFFSVSSSSGLKVLVVVGTFLPVFALFVVLQSNTKYASFEAAAALRKRFSHIWDVMCR
jgi:hypothetical protein